ncbi:MAG TPA: DUF2442 domain-containing protein [Nitrososphaera sp.]|nr:DUF2442 domain-containing protein [Nitrososphaera sp.]
MTHDICRVISFERMAAYTLRVLFDDASSQLIDFGPVLKGQLYGPLQDPTLFDQVRIDPEVHTLVWSNGADFDPAILHNGRSRDRHSRLLPRSGPSQRAHQALFRDSSDCFFKVLALLGVWVGSTKRLPPAKTNGSKISQTTVCFI